MNLDGFGHPNGFAPKHLHAPVTFIRIVNIGEDPVPYPDACPCHLHQLLMLRAGARKQAVAGCAMGVFHMIILLDFVRHHVYKSH